MTWHWLTGLRDQFLNNSSNTIFEAIVTDDNLNSGRSRLGDFEAVCLEGKQSYIHWSSGVYRWERESDCYQLSKESCCCYRGALHWSGFKGQEKEFEEGFSGSQYPL